QPPLVRCGEQAHGFIPVQLIYQQRASSPRGGTIESAAEESGYCEFPQYTPLLPRATEAQGDTCRTAFAVNRNPVQDTPDNRRGRVTANGTRNTPEPGTGNHEGQRDKTFR